MKLLALCYLIPLCRLVGCVCLRRRFGRWRRAINLWCGRADWAIHCVRETIGLTAVIGWLGYCAFQCLAVRWIPPWVAADFWCGIGLAIGAIGLSCWVRWDITRLRVALLHYAKQWPQMHPREYFHAYFAGFGPLPIALPATPPLLARPVIDFRRRDGDSPQLRCWPVIHGTCSTLFMSSQVLLARRRCAPTETAEIFDGLMAIWGARLMMLARSRVVVEGLERLRELRGLTLLCCNHKSALDFAVVPAALSSAPMPHRSSLRIRYLVARDHFLDNWFLYRGIQIGRAIEAAGMIFVNRRGTAAERRQAIPDAVRQLVAHRVDVAIYPQGTRAPGNIGPTGERWDAGYYSVRRKGRRRLGDHVKKGAAHLAVAAALQLRAESGDDPLHVVPIAVMGTGTALPKGSLRIQTGAEIKVVIGPVLTLDRVAPSDAEATIEKVHDYIDRQLEVLQGVRGYLATRFLTGIHHTLSVEEIEAVADAVKEWPHDPRLLYTILDNIYAQPPHTWRHWERALAQLLKDRETADQFATLYHQLVGDVTRSVTS